MKKEFEKEQKGNQTDDIFPDMPDMGDDEKFCQWLEEEYIKEADAIGEALMADHRFEDNQDIAEKLRVSRDSFYQRAREEGLLDEITSRKKKHSYMRFRKIAGIAGVCLICVFAASMSSEANRKYVVNSVRILSGNDSQLLADNTADNERATTEESDAIADIEEKLGVEVPKFYYRPGGMKFESYEISELTSVAYIKYELKDTSLLFYIDKQQEEKASNISSINGKQKTVVTISKDWGDIVIKETQDEADQYLTYSANWVYNDVLYTITGKIELEDLKKIIEEIKF